MHGYRRGMRMEDTISRIATREECADWDAAKLLHSLKREAAEKAQAQAEEKRAEMENLYQDESVSVRLDDDGMYSVTFHGLKEGEARLLARAGRC
jgi:predicted  nucleic acid-binding Zn-ribbon protein